MSQLWSIKEPFPSDASQQSVDKACDRKGKDEGGLMFPCCGHCGFFPYT